MISTECCGLLVKANRTRIDKLRRELGGEEEREYEVITEPGGDGDGDPAALFSKMSLNADEHPNRSRVQHWQLV